MFPGTGEPPTSTLSESLPEISIVSREENNESANSYDKRKIIKISAGSGLSVGTVLAVVLIVYFEVIKKPNQSSNDPSFGGPYKRQAIATDTKECSNIGEKILKDNGSAVDAAIAAMFCLGVVSMHSSGIGGGGVMLVYNRSLQEATVIDFRETASSLAHRDMFKDNKEKAQKGGLSIAVPGEIRGLHDAWQRHGRLRWKKLVQPAIDLARKGFKITEAVKEALETFKEDIRNDTGLSELFLDGNKKEPLPKTGHKLIKNEKYAKTLEEVQNNPESFYTGPLANDVADDIKKVNGTIKLDDLKNYTSISREPYKVELSSMNMYLTPPPTSGAVLALILNILKGYNLTSPFGADVNSSVLTYHRIIEAFKFSYAWRSRLGDPAFHSEINKVAKAMLNQTLADRLRHKIWDNLTHDNVSYYAQTLTDTDYGTTHVAVLAPNGDAVSVTTTINRKFGSKYRSNVTGIIYNNEMEDFDIPGHNIVDGISPSPFNFPAPNKRPFSSISPAILTNDNGDVQLVIGASGGKRITTAVSLVLMNKLWFEQSLSEAVDKPRLHSELVPDRNVSYEKIPSDTSGKYRMGKEILEGLEERGHNVAGEKLIAVVQAVFRDPEKGIFAKSDPRKHGAPAGE